jgi:hypothetical protein
MRKRGRDLFEAGNYDAMKELNAAKREYEGQGAAPKQNQATAHDLAAGLELAKATLLDQIAKARARKEDATNLELLLGRLEAQINQTKNQPV